MTYAMIILAQSSEVNSIVAAGSQAKGLGTRLPRVHVTWFLLAGDQPPANPRGLSDKAKWRCKMMEALVSKVKMHAYQSDYHQRNVCQGYQGSPWKHGRGSWRSNDN